MDETPKRFDRIVAILIQLQSKRIVRAQDLAQRFEVSLRTIYRDIKTLDASGVPIYSEPGKGYSLVNGYHLPPVMFTREEATSFIAAEKLMQKFTDKELGSHYASASFKLRAVLQDGDKDWLTNIESNILMQPAEKLFNEKVPNTLAVLFKSIAGKTQVMICYKSSESTVAIARTVEPVGIFHDYHNWYMFGYCQLRNDYRQFRTDRIHDINSTDQPFTKSHQPLASYLQQEEKKILTTKVRILVDSKIAKYLDYEKNYYGFVEEKVVGQSIEMSFLCRDLEEGFARWFLMFGDYATILEPESLNDRVLELLTKMQAKMKVNHPVLQELA